MNNKMTNLKNKFFIKLTQNVSYPIIGPFDTDSDARDYARKFYHNSPYLLTSIIVPECDEDGNWKQPSLTDAEENTSWLDIVLITDGMAYNIGMVRIADNQSAKDTICSLYADFQNTQPDSDDDFINYLKELGYEVDNTTPENNQICIDIL